MINCFELFLKIISDSIMPSAIKVTKHPFNKCAILSVAWLQNGHLGLFSRFQMNNVKFVGRMFNLAFRQNINSSSFNFLL